MPDDSAQLRYPPTRKPMGECLAAVYDPDGNLLGLVQRTPSEGQISERQATE